MFGPLRTPQMDRLLGPVSSLAPRGRAGLLRDWGTWVLIGSGLLLLGHPIWGTLHRLADLPSGPNHASVSLTLGLALVVLAGRVAVSRETADRARRGWRLIALGLLASWIGNLLWAIYQDLLYTQPSPSLADLAYLTSYPLVLGGLLCLGRRLDTRAGRLQFWLDAATVAIGVGAAVWFLLLDPLYRAGSTGPLEPILATAYPVGDIVLLFAVLTLVQRDGRDPRVRALVWLGAGLLVQFVGDALFAYQTLKGVYVSGGASDSLFDVAAFLTIWAPFLAHRRASLPDLADQARAYAESPPASWAPYAAVGLAYGLLLHVSGSTWGTPLGGLILGAALIAVLVSARQLLSARENERLRAEQAAREAEARFSSLIRRSSDAVLLLGPDLRVRFASLASAGVLGYEPESLVGRLLLDLVHAADRPRIARFLKGVLRHPASAPPPASAPRMEWRICQEEGGVRTLETVATNLLADPTVGGLVLNSRDIGDRRRLEERLQHVAFHDSLTGLANRTLLQVRTAHALARADRAQGRVAVLLLDLDNFKTVNDGLGQGQGDELLRILAVRLLRSVRPSDTVARLGGDELAVLLEEPFAPAAIGELAERVLARMAEPVALEDREVPVSASLGIAVSGPGSDAETLLKQAEVAMYTAKARGKAQSALYEPGMHGAAMERIDLEMDLRKGLGRGEIRLHYQPIVCLESGAFVGAEALVRWQHPSRGLLFPDSFVPIAEGRSELILALGRTVLREACRHGAAWQSLVPRGTRLHLAVNVSVMQILHSDLAAEVADALAESGLDPRALVLEITEGTLMQGAESVLRQLHELKALGVRLAIDDFGTGYSALGYLNRFPVDILKIDKSFVNCIRHGRCDTRLAGAIAALARAFGMTAVAEGVESDMQAQAMRHLGCSLAQGYLYSRPVPASVVESDWIARLGPQDCPRSFPSAAP